MKHQQINLPTGGNSVTGRINVVINHRYLCFVSFMISYLRENTCISNTNFIFVVLDSGAFLSIAPGLICVVIYSLS